MTNQMTVGDMFEKAIREDLKFHLQGREVTLHKAYTMQMKGTFSLEALASQCLEELSKTSKFDIDSMDVTSEDPAARLKLDIVMHIIKTRKAEAEENIQRKAEESLKAETAKEAKRLLAARRNKSLGDLSDEKLEEIAKG